MTEQNRIGSALLLMGACILIAILMGWNSLRPAFGSASSGLPATMATTSVMAVGPQQNIAIFPASTCSSRAISTVASGVMLSFGEAAPYSIASTTVSGKLGIGQLASTTVVYDSGQYGCGLVTAYGFASSSITVVEYR